MVMMLSVACGAVWIRNEERIPKQERTAQLKIRLMLTRDHSFIHMFLLILFPSFINTTTDQLNLNGDELLNFPFILIGGHTTNDFKFLFPTSQQTHHVLCHSCVALGVAASLSLACMKCPLG